VAISITGPVACQVRAVVAPVESALLRMLDELLRRIVLQFRRLPRERMGSLRDDEALGHVFLCWNGLPSIHYCISGRWLEGDGRRSYGDAEEVEKGRHHVSVMVQVLRVQSARPPESAERRLGQGPGGLVLTSKSQPSEDGRCREMRRVSVDVDSWLDMICLLACASCVPAVPA
jgi:hypothetical protein